MVNKDDFIELEYTGTLSENNAVFDTTDIEVAKKANSFNPNAKYGPAVICLGQNLLVPGLEKDIIDNKEVGKEYSLDLEAADAFGKKDPKKLRLVPLKVFKEKKINPYPGLQVQIDNSIATIKTVTGGRCIVDFNSPLSGHDVKYTYKIVSVVDDAKRKVDAIFNLMFGVQISSEDKDGKLLVKLPESIPAEIIDAIKAKVKELAKVDLAIEQEVLKK